MNVAVALALKLCSWNMWMSLLPITAAFEISVAHSRLAPLSATPAYEFDWVKRVLRKPEPLNVTSAPDPTIYSFAPDPSHAPSDVILGVLNALRYDSADRLFLESRGCKTFLRCAPSIFALTLTLLRCASPSSIFAQAAPLDVLKYFARSKYEILIHWRKVIVDGLRISRDNRRAFQTTRLQDLENNWIKVKWTLVLDKGERPKKDDDGDDRLVDYYYDQEGEDYLGVLDDDFSPADQARTWLVESVIVENHH